MRTADQWADACRILPPGSAEPGQWRSSRVPYMVPVMQAASNPRYRRVVLCCGSQMSKTETLLNVLGHRLDDDPQPCLFVAATQKQAESISTSRVMPMFRSTPTLLAGLDTSKQGNKVSEKFVHGQRLGFAWAGSATELSSHPVALVLLDELDRMAADTGGEGDPLTLSEARTATYPDAKVLIASTPTLEGGSPIWRLFEGGTQFRWSWPCPECKEFFVPCYALLKWPEKATPQEAKREARLACPHCGSLIGDEHRAAMNAAGRYECAGDPDSDTASFWISGLASPWRTFGDAAKAWLEAVRSGITERMQATMNTVFGELFRLAGEAPKWERVAQLRSGYESGAIPEGVRVLTSGVDVQGDRLVYAVRGWGYRSESWLIRYGELWGDTDKEAVWMDLGELLDAEFGQLRIKRMLIDSGYRPGPVYSFCRRYLGRALATKGHDHLEKPLYASRIDVTLRGQVVKGGLRLWHVDSSYFKGWLYSRLEWPTDQPGGWHLPSDADDDYCQQVVAEQRIVKPTGRVVWIRTQKANHYLDAEMLNCAAAHVLHVHTLRLKPTTAAMTATAPTVATSTSTPAQSAPIEPARQRPHWSRQPKRKNWVRSW